MTTIKINGMKCGHCSGAVTQALESIEGISEVMVNLDKGEATYRASSSVDPAVIKDAVMKIGFEVEG